MKNIALVLFLGSLLSVSAKASDTVFRIDIGKDFTSYSNADLQRRVWELERAVGQLQMKVFQLETAKPEAKPEAVKTWSCIVSAMGEEYNGAGDTKASATNAAMDNCRKNSKDTFFCKNPRCEQ